MSHCYDCKEVFRKLDDYLDRSLEPEELESVRAHLELCEECANCCEYESSLLRCVREKLSRIDCPGDLMKRISARLAEVERRATN